MSVSHNRYQAQRWIATALEDMQAVQALTAAGLHAQACFYAQQAAEKALKAIWFAHDTDPWGHSNSRLLMDFAARDKIDGYDNLMQQARLLDQFYVPTRYPDGLPDLTPGQVYGVEDATRAAHAAMVIVEFCQQWLSAG
jgi:HEPN domain-containing protein